MSYPSQNRLPYGMATVQPIPGMPGMAGVAVPGMHGMTPVQVAGISRVPNGMSAMYQSEKSSGLYPGANPSYQSLAQQGYLTQSGSLGQPASLGQPGAAFYGTSSQHPTYLPVSSPSSQQRYMVSAGYPSSASLVSSPSMVPGAATGYPLTAGAGYSLSAQPSSLAQPMPVAATTLSSAGQSQYPTYLGSQLTPLQISPSQNPYAASATGHPLYPGSPYASLQMAGAQMPSGQIPGRSQAGSGLPLGYPASPLGSAGFYPGP